jgi:hypothetical protein
MNYFISRATNCIILGILPEMLSHRETTRVSPTGQCFYVGEGLVPSLFSPDKMFIHKNFGDA